MTAGADREVGPWVFVLGNQGKEKLRFREADGRGPSASLLTVAANGVTPALPPTALPGCLLPMAEMTARASADLSPCVSLPSEDTQ